MSTEAEIVEFEGRRYRVAGKSGPGVEPKVGMVLKYQYLTAPQSITKIGNDGCLYFDNGCYASRGESGAWEKSWYKILAPLDASPPAETPRCEAPGWCGRGYWDDAVPTFWDGSHRIVPCCQSAPGGVDGIGRQCTRSNGCPHLTYCSPACADRARAAAAPKPAMGPPAVHMSCGKPHMPSEACPIPIPAVATIAKGWETAETDMKCECGSGSNMCLRRIGYAGRCCLDCAERRGAIERVEAVTCMRAGCDRLAAANGLCAAHGEQAAKIRAATATAPKKPLDPWKAHLAAEFGIFARMIADGRLAAVPNPKPAKPWTPSDPDADIPNAWE